MGLPSRIVSIACHHVMPCVIIPDASVYVVMTTLMPIHRAAMLYVDQVRRDSGVGARSGFRSGLADRSASTVTKSTVYEAASISFESLTRAAPRGPPVYVAATAHAPPCPRP